MSCVRKETEFLKITLIKTQQPLSQAPNKLCHKRVLMTSVGIFKSEADGWK